MMSEKITELTNWLDYNLSLSEKEKRAIFELLFGFEQIITFNNEDYFIVTYKDLAFHIHTNTDQKTLTEESKISFSYFSFQEKDILETFYLFLLALINTQGLSIEININKTEVLKKIKIIGFVK